MTGLGARGERTFKAGDREVTILFTNRALAGAEKRLGKGIVGVAQGLVNGASGIGDIAALLQVGMEAHRADIKAGGNQISEAQAYAALDQAGFATVAEAVMEAVAAVLSYSSDAETAEETDPGPNA